MTNSGIDARIDHTVELTGDAVRWARSVKLTRNESRRTDHFLDHVRRSGILDARREVGRRDVPLVIIEKLKKLLVEENI